MRYTALERELQHLRDTFARDPSEQLKERIELTEQVLAACAEIVPEEVRDGSFDCRDCGCEDAESYMVHDLVWVRAWPSYTAERRALLSRHGPRDDRAILVLCVPCLEKRLGRKLAVEDLRPIPFNAKILQRVQAR